MALIKFELKKEHLILLKFLNWEGVNKHKIVTSLDEGAETPFGGIDIIEDVGVMLYGKPDVEFDPLESTTVEYSEEQISFIREIVKELPMALEVVLFLQTFELGHYVCKWNLKNWRKK